MAILDRYKSQLKFCGTVTVAGIDRAWKESSKEDSQTEYYNPSTYLQTMGVVYTYLRLPWARRRKSWLEYLSFLAKMVLDHLSKRPLTPEQVDSLATVVLYLNRTTRGKGNELSYIWQNWERLHLVQEMVKQAISNVTESTGRSTELSLYISNIRFIDDPAKRLENMYTLERLFERSIPDITDTCLLAQLFRDYALVCTEFEKFHQDAIEALAQSRKAAATGPFLDAQVRTLLAWPSVFFGRRY